MSSRGKSITCGEIETHYLEFGSGPTLVLLHGSGPGVSAWGNWSGVAQLLARRNRVLAPDMVGFGFTVAPPGLELSIKTWVRQLIAFLDATRTRRAVLIGNSFGGGLALAASLRHPDRIAGLVLMGTPSGEFEQSRALANSCEFEPSLESMTALLRCFPYDPSLVTPQLVAERLEVEAAHSSREAIRALQPTPGEGGRTPLVRGVPLERLATIETPALILHGREDRVIPIEVGMRTHRNMPQSDFVSFGRCGHWVQVERQAEFVGQCAAFAERIGFVSPAQAVMQ